MPPALYDASVVVRRECLWALEDGVTHAAYVQSDARAVTIVCTLAGGGAAADDSVRPRGQLGHAQLDPIILTGHAQLDPMRLVGHVQLDPMLGRLRQLIVLPQFRRLGIGRALVGAVVRAHGAQHGGPEISAHEATLTEADTLAHDLDAAPHRADGFDGTHCGTPQMQLVQPQPPTRKRPRGTSVCPPLLVHAHARSAPFYEQCGFVRVDEVYESNGVECVRMEHRPPAVGASSTSHSRDR